MTGPAGRWRVASMPMLWVRAAVVAVLLPLVAATAHLGQQQARLRQVQADLQQGLRRQRERVEHQRLHQLYQQLSRQLEQTGLPVHEQRLPLLSLLRDALPQPMRLQLELEPQRALEWPVAGQGPHPAQGERPLQLRASRLRFTLHTLHEELWLSWLQRLPRSRSRLLVRECTASRMPGDWPLQVQCELDVLSLRRPEERDAPRPARQEEGNHVPDARQP